LAALGALLVACGDGGSGGGADAAALPDGGAPTDAAPEADGALAEGPIEIRIVNESYPPVDGAPVLLYDRSGVFLGETATDEEGTATAVVTTGSTAVILLPELDFSGNQSVVVAGVEPGDHILFYKEDLDDGFPVAMDVEVDAYPGAGIFYSFRACGETFSSVPQATLDIPPRCIVDGKVGVSVLASDASELLAYRHDEVEVGDPAILGGTWAAPDPLEVSFDDIPSGIKKVAARVWMMSGDQAYSEFGGVEAAVDGPSATLSPMDGPASYGAERVVSLDVQRVQWLFAFQNADHRIAGDSAGLTLHTASELLPWYAGPAYSPETQTLTWTRSAGGRAPDAIYVTSYWIETGSDRGGTIQWILPPTANAVVIPPLPEAYASHLPQRPSETYHELTAVERSDWDDFRAARQTGWLSAHPERDNSAPFTIRRSHATSQ
jgi:hypothetical protein